MQSSQIAILIIIVILIILIVLFLLKSKECPSKIRHKMKRTPVRSGVKDLTSFKPKAKPVKSETIPVFLRNDGRFIVTAPKIKVSDMKIPKHFDIREAHAELGMAPVFDQGACGSCWAFSSSASFSDRVKIATNGKELPVDDHISQYHLAACMKCGGFSDTVCTRVCDGNYMDDVMNYIKKTGVYSFNTIKIHKPLIASEYICFKPPVGSPGRVYKAKDVYRVNTYSVGELSGKEKREYNALRIAYDIYTHGPVAATIKVFDPLSSSELDKNFYLYKSGIYGYPWSRDPTDSDGYHALNIVGFGVETVKGVDVEYWILRNSWGESWGINGYCKIVKGQNRAIVESDVWAADY